MTQRIVLNVGSPTPPRRDRLEGAVYAENEPLWLDMQDQTRARIEGHPASAEEKAEMLDMLGLR